MAMIHFAIALFIIMIESGHRISASFRQFYEQRRCVSNAKQVYYFLIHIGLYFTTNSSTLLTSSSLSVWCIGRQMTLLAILWAFGRFSGLALSKPR